MKRKKGYFSISAVAKMFSIHQQTIRLYEKEGLINPGRSEGNTRLFSDQDVDKLEEVIYLTHQLGINLAGVEMILKLRRQIERMQKDMNKMFEQTQRELAREAETSKQAAKATIKELVKAKQMSIPQALLTAPVPVHPDEAVEQPRAPKRASARATAPSTVRAAVRGEVKASLLRDEDEVVQTSVADAASADTWEIEYEE